MPTSRELKAQLHANLMTVGRAIEQLKAEGFVDTQGARGTFVAEHPPHLYRYALVFPSHPSETNWPRFWDAMAKEAGTIEREGPCRIQIYYDVDQFTYPNNPSYLKLLDEVRMHRLAGVIFAMDPWIVEHTPLMDPKLRMPMVSVTAPQPQKYANMSYVCLDTPRLYEKALDYFQTRGRKRLAVLSASGELDQSFERIKAGAAQRGIQTQPYWMQMVSPQEPKPARSVTHLMMSGYQLERPDAVLITDDNLLSHATAGLVDAGVRVPEDIDVVAHCNFPWPTSGVVTARRIGFDARQVLRTCVRSIDLQRKGQQVDPQWVTALFEDELEISGAARTPRI